MTSIKKLLISAILLTATFLFIFSIALDLSRLSGLNESYNSYNNDFIKGINVILAAALVWLAGKDSLSPKDNSLMKLVFAVICLGEILFLLAEPVAAIAAFAVCQSLLILRHGKGLLTEPYIVIAKSKKSLLVSVLILASLIIVTSLWLNPFGKRPVLSFTALSYWIILSISLLTALANLRFGSFPRTNSRMIAIGMVCFYCCDILVGLTLLLPGGAAWMLADSLIWVFYTPAITLLALSCYNFESSLLHINKIALGKTRALK